MRNHGALSGRFGGIDVFFHATFRGGVAQPLSTGVWDNGKLRLLGSEDSPLVASGNVSAFAGLRLVGGETERPSATAVVGVSCISPELARRNAEEQVGTKTFEELVAEAYAEWDARLGVVELAAIDGAAEARIDDTLQTAFWTALYHTLIAPSTYSESGGQYLSFDRSNAPPFPVETLGRDVRGDRHLSDMSIWDTHRCWNPLANLLQPDIGLAYARSLVRMIQAGGDLPRWPLANGYTGCMVSNHAGQIILDTCVTAPPPASTLCSRDTRGSSSLRDSPPRPFAPLPPPASAGPVPRESSYRRMMGAIHAQQGAD